MVRPYSKGMSMVEIVIAAAIVILVVTAASQVWQLYFSVSRESSQKAHSAVLTEGAAEYFYFLRDQSWSRLIAPIPLDNPIYLSWNGYFFATSSSPATIDNQYSVQIIFSEIYRDTDFDIVPPVGNINAVLDPDSRYMSISIGSPDLKKIYSETPLLIHDTFQN